MPSCHGRRLDGRTHRDHHAIDLGGGADADHTVGMEPDEIDKIAAPLGSYQAAMMKTHVEDSQIGIFLNQ